MSDIIAFPVPVRRHVTYKALEEFDCIGTVGPMAVSLAREIDDPFNLVHVVVEGPVPGERRIIETTGGDDLSLSVAELAGKAALNALLLAAGFDFDPEDI